MEPKKTGQKKKSRGGHYLHRDLFPGAGDYQPKQEVMSLPELRRMAMSEAARLGPDHPTVKLLRRELADRMARGR